MLSFKVEASVILLNVKKILYKGTLNIFLVLKYLGGAKLVLRMANATGCFMGLILGKQLSQNQKGSLFQRRAVEHLLCLVP